MSSIFSELKTTIENLGIPTTTVLYEQQAPETYVVLIPISEEYELFGDNLPIIDVHEVRVSLYAKGNYLETKNKIVKALLSDDFTITDRRYIEYEDDTGYHHFAIDVAKYYEMEE